MPCFGLRPLEQPEVIPRSAEEIETLGWNYGPELGSLDIVLVNGDALVDHPSFGAALLARWLIAHGFRTAVLPQPAWEGEKALADFTSLPRPRLFAGVSAGAIDSMLAHYTAFRKKRHDDAYTPGGLAGARPNRAVITYCGLLRRAWPGIPLVIGGLEASLRRASHYDFWSDSLRRSILPDSKADVLIYGMGEYSLLEAARAAQDIAGEPDKREGRDDDAKSRDKDFARRALGRACRFLPGSATMIALKDLPGLEKELETGENPDRLLRLPSHGEILRDPFKLMEATRMQELAFHQGRSFLFQVQTDGPEDDPGARAVLFAPPARPMSEPDLDALYALPYSRKPHPAHKEQIPAWEMIRTSITTHRGCGGGCSFCSLALHQGRALASRSRESVLAEAALISGGEKGKTPRWAGAISDVGGPSANMWQGECTLDKSRCRRPSCLFPKPCPGFAVDQKKAVALLREVAALPGVRHVRVASGVRFDMALQDPEALKAYTTEFTGGQLKVAPEHICGPVLRLMRKPDLAVFEEFMQAFGELCRASGLEQYVVPYIISAFPGCTMEHMREMAAWFARRGWKPRQAQCFIPTPGTVATAMYYSGRGPDGEPVYVARTDAERLEQHHLLYAWKEEEKNRPTNFKGRRETKPAKTDGSRPGKRFPQKGGPRR